MSDESLFARHLRLIEKDESSWSEEDRKEFERLDALKLPPLELKPTFWMVWKTQIQMGIGAAVMGSLVLVLLPNLKQSDSFNAKGSHRVSVIWERAGKVSPLVEGVELKDGDKVGASVISSEDAIAYWTITDNQMKVLGSAGDIESSQLELQSGVSKSFASSFELTAPNQGENLVVVVCPKTSVSAELKKPVDSLLNREFVSQLLSKQKVISSDCVFVGYRLRRLP